MHRVRFPEPTVPALPPTIQPAPEVQLPPGVSADMPFPKFPKHSPYLPPPGGDPEPAPARSQQDGFGRGDVVECESCGYVFVLGGKQVACRRCRRESVVKWRGT